MGYPTVSLVGHCTHDSANIFVADKSSQDGVARKARLSFKIAGGGLQHMKPKLLLPADYVVFNLSGLPSSSNGTVVEYVVQCSAEDSRLSNKVMTASFAQKRRRFRLLPDPSANDGKPRALRVGVVSCNGLHTVKKWSEKFAMWERLASLVKQDMVDLILYGGDQVYADEVWDHEASWIYDELKKGTAESKVQSHLEKCYRDVYFNHWRSDFVQDVLGQCPSYMMWDDHDIDDGWGSNDMDFKKTDSDYSARQILFAAAEKVFRQFQLSHNPLVDIDRASTCEYRMLLGKTGIIVVDGRSIRDYGKGRMLGKRQITTLRKWLGEWSNLQEPLQHLFVLVGVPIVHAELSFLISPKDGDSPVKGLKDDIRDQWTIGNNKKEAEDFLRALFEFASANQKTTQVTVLAGDAHIATAGRLTTGVRELRDGHPIVYQVTSSGIGYRSPDILGAIIGRLRYDYSLIKGKFGGRLLPIGGPGGPFHINDRNFAIIDLNKGRENGDLHVTYHAEGRTEKKRRKKFVHVFRRY